MSEHKWLTDEELDRVRQMIRMFKLNLPEEWSAQETTIPRLLADLDEAKEVLGRCWPFMRHLAKGLSILGDILRVPGAVKEKQ